MVESGAAVCVGVHHSQVPINRLYVRPYSGKVWRALNLANWLSVGINGI